MKAIALLGLAFCLSSIASAATMQKPVTGCVTAMSEKPSLDVRKLPSAHLKMVTGNFGWERDESGRQIELTLRHPEETASLNDGIMLRVIRSGCEDWTISYEFTVPEPSIQKRDNAYWLGLASNLLKEVAPANIERLSPLHGLAKALDKKARDPKLGKVLPEAGMEGKISSGEDYYTVEVENHGPQALLRVSYIYPL